MGYVKRSLLPGEEILLEVKIHPALALLPIVQVILMAVVVAGLLYGSMLIGATDYAAWGIITLGLSVLAAGNGLVWLVLIPNHLGVYLSWELVITNRRIIRKGGLFAVEMNELPLNKVETMSASQSGVWARLFGYGEINIVGMGGTRISITHVKKPMEFRNKAQVILDESASRQ